MLNKILLALKLGVVAVVSALGTQFVLAAQTDQQIVGASHKQARVVPADCAAATWPNIPSRCLERTTTDNLRIVVAPSR
jgi:hypothetical protein